MPAGGRVACALSARDGDQPDSTLGTCVACPAVARAHCAECSDQDTCTKLGPCNANYFNTNLDATDGCEATCDPVPNAADGAVALHAQLRARVHVNAANDLRPRVCA